VFSASFAAPSPGARAYGWLVAGTNALLAAAVLSLPIGDAAPRTLWAPAVGPAVPTTHSSGDPATR
jgi:hypothetical protein